MDQGLNTLARLIERTTREPELWERVLADPLGTAHAEGVVVAPRDVKALLGIAGATDHELLAVITTRLQRLAPAQAPALLAACTRYLFPNGPPAAQPRPRAADTGLPLGVRPEAELPAGQLAALDCLARFDLGPVRDYVAAEGPLPLIWLDDAILEFRRYLAIRHVFARPFAMFSEQVDEVWHAALLFTELYADLSQQVFGELAHHDPLDEPEPEQMVALWDAFHAAYTHLFGEPGYLWTLRSADCMTVLSAGAVVAGTTTAGGSHGG